MRTTHWIALVAIGLTLPLWLLASTANGDLWNRWTDHLRHEAEALALEARPLSLYTRPYGESTAGLLPCADHEGLWADVGVPYPPLGVAIHWPVARLERGGLLPPRIAHSILTWSFGVVGLLATVLGARSLSRSRRWLFVAIAGPLLVGTGLSGFYDPVWVLFSLTTSGWGAALAYLVHFRGVVAFASVDSRTLRTNPFLFALFVANTLIAIVAAVNLGHFEVTSPLHFSRPAAWWFPAVTALVWWKLEPAFQRQLTLTAVLLFTDRQSAFWHLLLLIPLLHATLRTGSTRSVVLAVGWATIAAQAFLASWVPFPTYWLSLR